MPPLPQSVLHDYFQSIIAERSPAYLQIDSAGIVQDFGGQLQDYDIPTPQRGQAISEQVFFLASLLPLEDKPVHLPCIRFGQGRPAEVSIFPGAGADWVLLLDASEYDKRWSRIQQRTIDLSLLREYQEKIGKLKNEFISTVSHELRTPLTSIHGSLGLMLGGAVGDLSQDVIKLVNIAYNNTDRLVRLINNILDIEKIESGKMEFNFEPTIVQLLLEQALEANQEYAKSFGSTLKLGKALKEVWVHVDNDRIIQVLTNLLSNAAKFSPSNTEVKLSAERIDGYIRFSVQDHGPGLPEEFQEHIFEKFSRADNTESKKAGGTGLGLSISKAIIEKHNGSIGFTTEISKGTTFYFDIQEWSHEDY